MRIWPQTGGCLSTQEKFDQPEHLVELGLRLDGLDTHLGGGRTADRDETMRSEGSVGWADTDKLMQPAVSLRISWCRKSFTSQRARRISHFCFGTCSALLSLRPETTHRGCCWDELRRTRTRSSLFTFERSGEDTWPGGGGDCCWGMLRRWCTPKVVQWGARAWCVTANNFLYSFHTRREIPAASSEASECTLGLFFGWRARLSVCLCLARDTIHTESIERRPPRFCVRFLSTKLVLSFSVWTECVVCPQLLPFFDRPFDDRLTPWLRQPESWMSKAPTSSSNPSWLEVSFFPVFSFYFWGMRVLTSSSEPDLPFYGFLFELFGRWALC